MPVLLVCRPYVEYQGSRSANGVIVEGGFSSSLFSVCLVVGVTVQEALSPGWPLAVPCWYFHSTILTGRGKASLPIAQSNLWDCLWLELIGLAWVMCPTWSQSLKPKGCDALIGQAWGTCPPRAGVESDWELVSMVHDGKIWLPMTEWGMDAGQTQQMSTTGRITYHKDLLMLWGWRMFPLDFSCPRMGINNL